MNLPRQAATLLVAGVALLGFACHTAERPPEEETRALARALGATRVVEARLTAFDEWAAWAAGSALSDASKDAVYQSAKIIQQRKAPNRRPPAAHQIWPLPPFRY